MSAGWIVAVVEAATILTLVVLLVVGGGRRRALRARVRELERGRRRRRSVLSPEGAVKAVWETASLVRDKGVGGAWRSSISEIANWAQVERPDLVRLAGVDGCVAIVFSDIEDSTALNDRLGDRAFVRLLSQHNAIVTKQVGRHHGQVIKTQGDGFMIAFAEAAQATRCAIDVERALLKRRATPSIVVRIGIHYGSAVHRDNDIFGRNVALAARVAAMAEGGEILVSGSVADQLADIEELDLMLTEPRTVQLRGLAGDHLVASIDWVP
ncbi:adenylate/guanylate cyclase domain-containing protein [Aeromicrobium sp. CF3.5]|uniref:adenylate/guanylate cyclase domain-containing protein n=1 Tax=Aeromicrobium sp. CF3.5 TaxID=3373078 RepID=UPI003EE6C275